MNKANILLLTLMVFIQKYEQLEYDIRNLKTSAVAVKANNLKIKLNNAATKKEKEEAQRQREELKVNDPAAYADLLKLEKDEQDEKEKKAKREKKKQDYNGGIASMVIGPVCAVIGIVLLVLSIYKNKDINWLVFWGLVANVAGHILTPVGVWLHQNNKDYNKDYRKNLKRLKLRSIRKLIEVSVLPPKQKGMFKLALDQDYSNFDPTNFNSVISICLLQYMFCRLTNIFNSLMQQI